jgi:hypothetical protein
MKLFSENAKIATLFLVFFAHENMKKLHSNVAHNRPNFFSVLPTGPKPAQITFSVP